MVKSDFELMRKEKEEEKKRKKIDFVVEPPFSVGRSSHSTLLSRERLIRQNCTSYHLHANSLQLTENCSTKERPSNNSNNTADKMFVC